jgi:hypothetical protein
MAPPLPNVAPALAFLDGAVKLTSAAAERLPQRYFTSFTR